MKTGIIYDSRFLDHDTGPGHPERPLRLTAVMDRLYQHHLYEKLIPLPYKYASEEQIQSVHDPAYFQRIFQACEKELDYIDTDDSAICPFSCCIAQLAAGAGIAAADAVMSGLVHNVFCAVRPPGHHAETNRSMGFCLFNNIAITAQHLIDRYKLSRIAIVDFDVHHGNGTQQIFYSRNDVLFVSLHQHPSTLYPGTGFSYETGIGKGDGFTLNLPLQPNSDIAAYRQAILQKVVPALEAYQPEFLLLSSGFDAAADDPLANMQLTPTDFAWITQQLKQVAAIYCEGRIVSFLEGGYNLRSLAECAELHIKTLHASPEQDPLMKIKAGM